MHIMDIKCTEMYYLNTELRIRLFTIFLNLLQTIRYFFFTELLRISLINIFIVIIWSKSFKLNKFD